MSLEKVQLKPKIRKGWHNSKIENRRNWIRNFFTVEIYFRGVNATSTGERLLRRRDNRSTKHQCVEGQLSEQSTKILPVRPLSFPEDTEGQVRETCDPRTFKHSETSSQGGFRGAVGPNTRAVLNWIYLDLPSRQEGSKRGRLLSPWGNYTAFPGQFVRLPSNLPVLCSLAPDGMLLANISQPLSRSTAHSPFQLKSPIE